MRRRAFLGSLALGASGLSSFSWALPPSLGLLSQADAGRHGMRRQWVSHVNLDRSRDRLANLLLEGPTLFAQTKRGLLHAFDAETGGTQWAVQIGHRDHPSTAPAASEKYVAVVNGSTCYLLDRVNGHLVWERRLKHIPSGSIAVGSNWIYSPSVNGQLEVLGFEDPAKNNWNGSSFGQIDIAPLVSRTGVIWGTERGFVYFNAADRSNVNFRLDTRDAIAAPLGYWPPIVYAASRDGYLYAIDERNGERLWRFSSGTPINEAPLAVEGAVYVTPEAGGMHSLACSDGKLRWFSPRAVKFLAASAAHVYALDRFGDTLVLNVETGGQIDLIPTSGLTVKYANTQNDRLYMGNSTGMLLCLRELDLAEPMPHLLPEPIGAPKTDQETVDPAAAPADPAAPAAPVDDAFAPP